eukprot:CAMPEP_0171329074 /NCGR_PEP_ID=MMETSP0878-20121228/1015_1 /TAXON_ID=67004 /ORGANISM="Thalassiosira weissflogii, Strain CCMP1336" /LENGTH=106 /DNA_ID=CAMNT_0011828977 /DNA_START=43 /DNA_END=363 /DNA_ORIENTATION=+
MIRSILAIAIFAALALSTQAFVSAPVGKPALVSTTSLMASRVNAKIEKRKRNRENMRKFKKGGRRGTSRKKMMRKMQSSAARQIENEFIAKCFMTVPPPNSDDEKA